MKKIAFAIDNQKAETKIAEVLNTSDKNETYQVVGTLISNSSVMDFFLNKTTDILVYMEGLAGTEDSFDFVIKLHKKYPHVRIVFIAGQRSIGDKKLATLVAYHIYDIVAGEKVLFSDIANRIMNEATFEDVIQYLPETSGDLFGDGDFTSGREKKAKSARDSAERVAERALNQQQVNAAKGNVKDLQLQLSAAQSRIRQLEDEKRDWETEAGKEKMFLEKKFDADRKILAEQIAQLENKLKGKQSEVDRLSANIKEKSKRISDIEAELDTVKGTNSATIKALQADIKKTTADLESTKAKYDSCKSELDRLKDTLKAEKDALMASAQAEAEKLKAEAQKLLDEAEADRRDIAEQKELLHDRSFEEYKKAEAERIEQAKKDADKYVEDALASVNGRKQEVLDQISELSAKHTQLEEDFAAMMRKKEEDLIAEQAEAVKKIDEDKLRRKNELDILDQQLDQKRTELQSVQNSVDITREEKEAEIRDLRKEYQEQIDTIRSNAETEVEKARSEIADRINRDKIAADAELASEKKRLANELKLYHDQIEEEKKKLAEGLASSYRYDESHYIVPDRRTPKNKVISFLGAAPGSGNSTVALNTAMYLAKKGMRTIYVELDWQNPSCKTMLGVSAFNNGLEKAMKRLSKLDFGGIDAQIITKQKILNLKTSAADMQAKYPDMLSYLTFSRGISAEEIPNVDLLKGVISYLKHRKNYAYIVLDIPAYLPQATVKSLITMSDKCVVTAHQDFMALGNALTLKGFISENAPMKVSDDASMVVNMYVEKTVLPAKKMAELSGFSIGKVMTLANDKNAMLMATYRAIPAVLTSTNAQLLSLFKSIGDSV